MPGSKKVMRCAFCGKTQDQVDRMLVGPSVYICNECVELCHSLLHDDDYDPKKSFGQVDSAKNLKVLKPHEIKAVLDAYVIGQEEAKITLSVAVYNHYKRLKSNSRYKSARQTQMKRKAARHGDTLCKAGNR